MNKKVILFLIANLPLSLFLYYILAFVCTMFIYTWNFNGMLGLWVVIFSIIIIAIDLLILKFIKRLDFLTAFIFVAEVFAIGFVLYLWQRNQHW